jgi:hypothetical protein
MRQVTYLGEHLFIRFQHKGVLMITKGAEKAVSQFA